jgi:hypothetical protein
MCSLKKRSCGERSSSMNNTGHRPGLYTQEQGQTKKEHESKRSRGGGVA